VNVVEIFVLMYVNGKNETSQNYSRNGEKGKIEE
jgi:hypothetical protein